MSTVFRGPSVSDGELARRCVPSRGVNRNVSESVVCEDLPDRAAGLFGGVVIRAQVAQDDGLRRLPALLEDPHQELPGLGVGEMPDGRPHTPAVVAVATV